MHTGSTVINGPHQGALIDTVSGDEWFIHFQDRGLYGRICHLQPVTWKDGWPVIGVNPDEKNVGEPVFNMEKPDVGAIDDNFDDYGLSASDDFKDGKLNLNWQWLGNHYDSFCGPISDKQNGIRLYALNISGEKDPIIWKSANVLTQKLIYPMFDMKIKMDASGLNEGDRAGVCMTGGQYMAAYIEKNGESSFSVKVVNSIGGDADKKEEVESSFELEPICNDKGISLSDALKDITWNMEFSHDNSELNSEDMYFQNVHEPLGGKNPSLKVRISFAGSDYIDLGVDYTPSDHTWVGAKTGIFALSQNKASASGHADFLSVKCCEK